MTDCPTDAILRVLLAEVGDSLDDELIDHVGQCDSCCQRLQQLADEGVASGNGVEALLADDDFNWPNSETKDLTGSLSLPPTRLDMGADSVSQQTEPTEIGDPQLLPGGNASDGSLGHRFADYELLRQVGAGGMGVVYKSRQKSANRIVAVKLIRPDQLAMLPDNRREVWKSRFRSEAQAAARLDHEHVVTIYDVGEFEGTLYYSMQYIEGRSLSEIVQESPIENRRVAALIAKVARAVQHAHDNGILHRDIKPQNIMVRDTTHSTLSAGATVTGPQRGDRSIQHRDHPYVADFGLAKTLDQETDGSTHTGEVMGSPSFMSPEQAQDASRCTPSSDIYSLGATLYYSLTGRPPFRASSSLETLRQVIDEEPVPPRELNRAIELDLQTITLKTLSKEPTKRYASAAEFADDLESYLRGEPIRARPVSGAERFVRWCRRNPTIAALTGGIAVLLTVIAAVSLVSSIQLNRHVQRERAARQEAEEFFAVSLDVIHDMVTNYADNSLEHVPQMQQARRDLLNRAIVLYTRLSRSRPSNPQLMFEYALTRYRIAVLHDLLGEVEKAKLEHQDAIELFEQLRERTPDDHRLDLYWSRGHTMLGEALRKSDPDSARGHFDDALVVQNDLQTRFPTVTLYQRERSRTLNNLGLLLTETGEFSLAEENLTQAIELLQNLSDNDLLDSATLPEILADLGRSQINLGVLLRKMTKRAEEAKSWYERSIGNLERTVALQPDNRNHRFRLAVAEVDLANFLLMHVGDGKQRALEHARSAAERFAQLNQDFPGIPIYLYESANARNSLAGTLAMLGQTEASLSEFKTAESMLETMEAEFPEFSTTEAKVYSLRGRVWGGIGFLHSQDNDWKRASEFVTKAIDSQQKALQRQPQNPEILEFLDQHRAFQATVLQRLAE